MTMNKESLQFSVKESVWFERGQQISDILSMSLDPDISIQEHENYVSIRGALELAGEYYPREEETEVVSDFFSLRENMSLRTVDNVREAEDGIFSLSHKFPIDITIPMNRIDDLNDVYVMVESFDYEIPEDGRLQLNAELSISGIVGDKERAKENMAISTEDEERNTSEENNSHIGEDSLFEEESFVESTENEQIEEPSEISLEDRDQLENHGEIEEDTTFEFEVRKEPEEVEEFEEQEAVEYREENAVEESSSPQVELKSREEKKPLYAVGKENELEETELEEGQQEKPIRDENALYLTNILSSAGEERFSKIRLRIIQQGESLDSIAEDYEVSLNKLVQMNHLNDDHVQEGEIIYIPEGKPEN